jgi:hypothetical protein
LESDDGGIGGRDGGGPGNRLSAEVGTLGVDVSAAQSVQSSVGQSVS